MATVVRRSPELPGDRFTADEPVIALTFDDGPGSFTAPIAEELRRLDAPASFFVVGELAATSWLPPTPTPSPPSPRYRPR
ncbi:polysaccharide deacetylase family protein [Rhabdothermincola sediminis]|uniref:polysaccharide deacetylase family protein n=1 Tax=Rhabdothermincola sediminis TaxID=2751370 RepID=UPI001AA05C01